MKQTLHIVLVLLFLWLPSGAALANMAPPPSVVWFTLEYDTHQSPRLIGLQLIGCESAACQQPVLLQQYGKCEATGCLPGPVTLSGFSTSFGCASNRCRSTAYPHHGGTDFRLVAQFTDQVRLNPMTGKLPASYGEVVAWKVVVRESDLAITPDATIPAISTPYDLFRQNLGWLGLSILVELVVAGAIFQVWAHTDWHQWMSRLWVVLLANLASLPVVWLFFPAFGQFQSVGSRLLAVITLVISAFYVALLVIIYRAPRKVRLWAIPVTVLVFLASSAACLFMLGLNYYGNTTLYVQGLPATLVIVLSELFAVAAEAVLIAVLGKQPLASRWVWVTSLLMNAASFLVGLFLIAR